MKKTLLISASLISVAVILIIVKVFFLKYDFLDILPERGYIFKLDISTDTPNSKPIKITTFAPMNNAKQQIYGEESISDSFRFKVSQSGHDRVLQWTGENLSGVNKIKYVARIHSHNIKYAFSPETVYDGEIPKSFEEYLTETDLIQVNSKYIREKLDRITASSETLYDKITAIHNFITNDISYVNFSGELDAESTLRIMQGSCNGKSRLYVAMVRQLGIPARLVGGIILNQSQKKTIHQWVEIHINGQWVPFCPTNNWFAELPERYITLYYGDKVLFTHTAKIGFDYSFSYEPTSFPKQGLSSKYADMPVNILGLLEYFDRFNISIHILIYLLMLPLGALVSVILRNVIGLETFGIFLPILIASVLKGTGIVLGITAFFGIIFLVYFVNVMVSRLNLLYHPKMAILLSAVITTLILLFFVGVSFKNYDLINVVYFPVAIVAITVNRVMAVIDEEGTKKLVKVSLNTILVIAICYYFMNSTFLQLTMLSFPELILMFIGINILIGRWIGLRMSEYLRFKIFFRSAK